MLNAISDNLIIKNETVTVSSYTDKAIIMQGKSELYLRSETSPLINSTIDLQSVDSWVYFENIKPSVVISLYLACITINGENAVNKNNVRVSKYKYGTVVIPHSSTFQPLTIYTESNFGGNSKALTPARYTSLAEFDRKTASFQLRKGYMATFATDADGGGYSRVFIADKADLEVPVMPEWLSGTVSFIRVVNWEWVTKKGWAGYNPNDLKLVNCTWRYDWSAGGQSESDIEYVPIKQNSGWPGWNEITNKANVSHVLGYNEPDQTDQANLTVSQALSGWPEYMKTGLRIGSPAMANPYSSWLYNFLDSCEAKNYRVDYVVVHCYWGGKSPQNWYNDLKYIYDRTKRPLWITEWNNGANWTNESWPDNSRTPNGLLLTQANAAKQLNDLKGILQVLDTASFIERYAIYNWVEDARAIVLADTLTPAGKYYASNKSDYFYAGKNEYVPSFKFNVPALALKVDTKTDLLTLNVIDSNSAFYNGFVLERKINEDNFEEILVNRDHTVKSYSEALNEDACYRKSYRIKTILPDGAMTEYSNEATVELTSGGDIQYGNLLLSKMSGNQVLIKDPYDKVPAVVFGAPTNNNAVYVSPKGRKLVKDAFELDLTPWKTSSPVFKKDESVPYLIANSGKYNFGGLQAVANRVIAGSTWTKVAFSTAFETIPVVFVGQGNSNVSFATALRTRNISKTGFEVKLQKETPETGAVLNEMISYFAIEEGQGVINNKNVVVGKTGNVGAAYKKITYGDGISAANPLFMAQLQTCNADDMNTLRCMSVAKDFANVLRNRESSTATETVGWLLMDLNSQASANKQEKLSSFHIYPNPVKDNIYFSGENVDGMNVNIVNMQGVTVKNAVVNNYMIQMEDLPDGIYLLTTGKNEKQKIVKIK
ncbi:hypothetical protein FACS189413_18360 [Bacteroidia bacterium]|nr:hypothetical protein FACS189413_18360 [Bacteroidia bacterium]